MSEGCLMQFIRGTEQENYILSNDEITYFRTVYRRHTNFAIQTVKQSISGNINFGVSKSSIILNKTGDLVSRIYLCLELPPVIPKATDSYFAWVKKIGHAIVRSVSINIGGVEYDKQNGTWFDIWWELTGNRDLIKAYYAMIGNVKSLTQYNQKFKEPYTLFIPLQFWFNRHYTHAFPIKTLFYNDFIVTISLAPIEQLIVTSKNFDYTNLKIQDAYLLTEYIFLDTFEKNQILTSLNEYLIEQVQDDIIQNLIPTTYNLSDFRLPVKELYWCLKNNNYTSRLPFIYYSDTLDNNNYEPGAKEILEYNLIEASKLIVLKSISVGILPDNDGIWIPVKPGSSSLVDTFYVINKSSVNTYVNTHSLLIGNYNITQLINVIVTILEDMTIMINELTTKLTIQDISVPTCAMVDTRVDSTLDALVVQFSNYGLFLDGTGPQIAYARILFDGVERIIKLSYIYYNYSQPLEFHTNIPKNGILAYSFAINPESPQPSGFANFSRIDKVDLELWYNEVVYHGYKFLNLDDDNNLFIYALNYDILRVGNGFAGLAEV